MKIVAVEEHMVTPAALEAWEAAAPTHNANPRIDELLSDLGEGRLRNMDDEGIDVHVLSLGAPGGQHLAAVDAVPLVREANDAIAAAIAAHPDRFQGLASLPTPDVGASVEELRRTIGELGFQGVLLNGRTGSQNLDDPAFADVYAAAEELNVPIFIHPQLPTQAVRDAYYSGWNPAFDEAFAGWGIGWHYETGIQLLRMVYSGVFDRHPNLQVIVGHWGEVVLFYIERTQILDHLGLGLDRPLRDYLLQNVHYTGSGIVSERYLRWTLEVVGVERVMYSTDYPYGNAVGRLSNGGARRFLEGADLSDGDKARIAHGNWETLTAK